MVKNLYVFNYDCGRMGYLEGHFRATPEEVKALIGKRVYFGEVLGKHSDISVDLEEDHILLVTDNQDFLKMADDLEIDITSGFNPLEYLDEEVEDAEEEDDV